MKIPQLRTDGNNVLQTAAGEGDLAPEALRDIHNLLHPVDVGGKGGHDDAPVARLTEQGFK